MITNYTYYTYVTILNSENKTDFRYNQADIPLNAVGLYRLYIIFTPPLPHKLGGNIGEGRQNENLINIVNGEYRGIFDPPGNLPEKSFSTASRLNFRIT